MKLELAAGTFLLATSVLALALQAKPPIATPGATAAISTPTPTAALPLEHQVIAYYFHTDYRCASCRQIEAYSHAAIDSAFAAELASGRLVWRLVNLDEKGNEHFVKDYALFTKSLVVVEEAKGQRVRWKNLAKVWELLPNKAAFYGYVQDEVRAYLREAP